MWSKEKLSKEILGLTGAAVIVAVFVYGFIRVASSAVVFSYCEKNGIDFSESMEEMLNSWLPRIGFAAAAIIFVVLFLFLVGEKLEEAVAEILSKEVQLREEREKLVRALSHDIRTPLTSILSYSEYMEGRNGITESEMQEYAALMKQKAEQIKGLTDRLLDNRSKKSEKIEDGKLLMVQLAEEWEYELEENFQCYIDMEHCPSFSGEFDVQEFRRVFDNLASNIKKYADASQKISLEIKEKEGFLVMTQKNRKKSAAQHIESYKLGIESIRKIAENHGGKVTVEETEQDFSIEITLIKIN